MRRNRNKTKEKDQEVESYEETDKVIFAMEVSEEAECCLSDIDDALEASDPMPEYDDYGAYDLYTKAYYEWRDRHPENNPCGYGSSSGDET